MSFIIKNISGTILVEFNHEGVKHSLVVDSLNEVIPSINEVLNEA